MSDSAVLLPFAPGCRVTRLLRREKRFTAVTVDPATGGEVRAHTNNTGSMLGLLRPGVAALLSPALNPDRALKWTLEALALPGGHRGADPAWVGVNTLTPNRLLAAAWRTGLLPEARAYARMTPEFKIGDSRLDARFDSADGEAPEPGPLPPLYVECKNVTLVEDDQAQFPDAASERGRKHLVELTRLVGQGCRAALFFLVQRPDGECFAPADVVDPAYAEGLAVALAAGVEAWVWRARVTEAGIALAGRLPLAPAWARLVRPRSA
ncbi:DNA/RNA nuclease SfsA [Humidesulfovibrio idahonensis]